MRALSSRLKRLEGRKRSGGTNRVIEFDPLATTAEAALRSVGKPGRYLLAPRLASDDEWRAALRAQQHKLIAANVARPHTTKQAPKHATPKHEDVLAPGMRTKRALPERDELPEGGLRVTFKR